MKQEIESVPATYAGTRFRSTLEAHWAAFFNALGTRWIYEPAAFVMKGQRYGYTPDFHLPDLSLLLEVKPCPVNDPKLVDKYEAFGPELIRRAECRMFMFAVGYPRPGMQLHGWGLYGERGFRLEPLFGDEQVHAACILADLLRAEQTKKNRQQSRGWMSIGEIISSPEFTAYLERRQLADMAAS